MNYIERYWRDATPADAIKEPPMVARFRNYDEAWVVDTLVGVDRSDAKKWISDSWSTELCQVYDAPNPGEGWRLIDVATEKWQEGDELYDQSTGAWRLRLTPFQSWAQSFNRRRIIPAVTYAPFTWEDRDQLRGRWIIITQGNRSVREQPIDCFLRTEDGAFYIAQYEAQYLLDNAKFLDTGEPVGKKVAQ